MIDTSNAKYELGKITKYAVKWFNNNGFDGVLEKQYNSKAVFLVNKDGIENRFEVPTAVADPAAYMRAVGETFEMKKKIINMMDGLNRRIEK